MPKIHEDKHLDPYLFEFFIYQKMYHLINRGKLCCNASVSYNDINHDLINDALVDDVERIAREFGYPKIPVYCQERLDEALAALEAHSHFSGHAAIIERGELAIFFNRFHLPAL